MSVKNKSTVKWIITLLIPLILYFAIPVTEVLTMPIKMFIVVTMFGILAWMFELLPAFVTGLVMTILYILTKATDGNTAFMSWTNQIVWLCLSGLLVGAAFEKTGLMRRISFSIIKLTGCSYKGVIIGLFLSGIPMCVLLPNLSARVTLYAFLAVGICRALDLKPGSSAAAGVMLAGANAALAARYIIPASNDDSFLAMTVTNNVLPMKDYLLKISPLALVMVALMLFLVLKLFKPEQEVNSSEYVNGELQKMGKLQGKELKFLILTLIVVVLMFTNKVPLAWLFVLLACVCFFPGIDILKAEDMQKVNFPMIIFVATALTIGNVAAALGVGGLVAQAFQTAVAGRTLSNFVFYPIMWFFGVLFNFVMTPVAATAAFCVPLASLAEAVGMNVHATLFSFTMGVEQLIFTYEWAPILFIFSFGMFTTKQFMKYGAVRMAVSLLFMLVIVLPYWMLVGMV